MLQPTPWLLLERLAESVPGPAIADHELRISNPGLRARFACEFRAGHRASYDAGMLGEPCVRCGTFTHAFCETCFLEPRDPPFAVCTHCDAGRLVCLQCESSGRSWADGCDARKERGDPPEGIMEISGFKDESGEVVRINPPLLLPVTECGRLHFHIRRHREEFGL